MEIVGLCTHFCDDHGYKHNEHLVFLPSRQCSEEVRPLGVPVTDFCVRESLFLPMPHQLNLSWERWRSPVGRQCVVRTLNVSDQHAAVKVYFRRLDLCFLPFVCIPWLCISPISVYTCWEGLNCLISFWSFDNFSLQKKCKTARLTGKNNKFHYVPKHRDHACSEWVSKPGFNNTFGLRKEIRVLQLLAV